MASVAPVDGQTAPNKWAWDAPQTQMVATEHIVGGYLFAPTSELWCSVGKTLLHPETIYPPYLRRYDPGSY
jgi:hypothetical protein